MKREVFYTFAVSMMVLTTGSSWAQSNEGVVIGGVTWAKTNVGNMGEFASSPEEYGGYFTYDEAYEACPDGWRTPSVKELEALAKVDSAWTTVNDVNGRKFGSGENAIFFPAAGWRQPFFDTEGGLGTEAKCWSGSGNGNNRGYTFVLSEINNKDYFVATTMKGYALSVRCVRK